MQARIRSRCGNTPHTVAVFLLPVSLLKRRTAAINVAYVVIIITVIAISRKRDPMTAPTSTHHLVQPSSSAVLYSSLTKAIASRASEDRYVVLAMVDEAFVDMALNFHEASLSRHHIDNYLFVGIGSSTCDVLYRQSLACFHYVDDRSSGEASEFGDTDFMRKMNIRTDMILEALAANFTVVHTDIDVIFLANPLHEIKVTLQLKHCFYFLLE